MKRLIILLGLLFASNLSAIDIKGFLRENDASKCSLLLVVKDVENSHYLSAFKVNDLKLCDYPKGPLRNNEVTCDDFSKVSGKLVDQLDHLIKQNQAIELKNFCVDDFEIKDDKHKTCLFEYDANKFCYAFRLIDYPIQELRGVIIQDTQLDKLYELNDEATSNEDVDDGEIDDLDGVVIKPQPEIPPSSKCVVFLKEIASSLILKFFDAKAGFDSNYDKVKQFLKKQVCGK